MRVGIRGRIEMPPVSDRLEALASANASRLIDVRARDIAASPSRPGVVMCLGHSFFRARV